LLHAPAGYGKTGAATRWLRDEAEAHPHVHWFRCSPRSASDFWKALADDLCAVAGAQGGTGQESTEPVGTNGEHPGAPTIGPEAVAGILQRLDAPLTLVIDDYHHATSGENDLALAELSAAMPDLALVAIGRRLVLLDGPLVASRTRVRGFGPHDLELTDDQIRRISERSELRDHPRLPEALERAGGWPLAVRVALDRLPRDSAGADPEPPRTADPRNPLDNLAHFTLQHLEIIGESARRILLAASQLDAISIDQAAEFVGSDPAATRQAVYELLELGVLEPVVAGDRSEFRCHTAVRTTLAARSERSFSPAQRESLMRGRADRIKETAPFTAFELFCSADCYADAESLLARFFTTITDETASCAPCPRRRSPRTPPSWRPA
jgi:ATP/maltotriose-dependent transcriptional regulator MalT